MKKLEELKTSPAPWRKAVNPFGMGEDIIWDAEGRLVQYSGLDTRFPYERHKANHSMMVAAPSMYAALWKLCYGDIGLGNCRNCIGMGGVKGNCEGCMFKEAHDALERASGDDGTKKCQWKVTIRSKERPDMVNFSYVLAVSKKDAISQCAKDDRHTVTAERIS